MERKGEPKSVFAKTLIHWFVEKRSEPIDTVGVSKSTCASVQSRIALGNRRRCWLQVQRLGGRRHPSKGPRQTNHLGQMPALRQASRLADLPALTNRGMRACRAKTALDVSRGVRPSLSPLRKYFTGVRGCETPGCAGSPPKTSLHSSHAGHQGPSTSRMPRSSPATRFSSASVNASSWAAKFSAIRARLPADGITT